jgi:phosphatidylinositol 4-kinase B
MNFVMSGASYGEQSVRHFTGLSLISTISSHLLVTRPSKSRALECFVVEIAQRSTHIAMIVRLSLSNIVHHLIITCSQTLWFMQASLKDLSLARTDSQSFVICQRVLHKCHEIIFGDVLPPSIAPYAALSLPSQSRYPRTKVKHNVEPSLVGIGIVLAGAPAMPLLTKTLGHIPIEQGRAEEDLYIRSVEAPDDETAAGGRSTQAFQINDDDDEGDVDVDDNPDSDDTPPTASIPHDTETITRPGVLTRRRTVGAAQTVPALPLHLRTIRRSRASEDPLGQLDTDHVAIPYLSSPSISSARPAPRSAAVNLADVLLERYDNESQLQLLRSHYCRSEVCVSLCALYSCY